METVLKRGVVCCPGPVQPRVPGGVARRTAVKGQAASPAPRLMSCLRPLCLPTRRLQQNPLLGDCFDQFAAIQQRESLVCCPSRKKVRIVRAKRIA